MKEGHRQVKERCQWAQNRLQRNKFAKRYKVIFVVTIGGGIAVFAVLLSVMIVLDVSQRFC